MCRRSPGSPSFAAERRAFARSCSSGSWDMNRSAERARENEVILDHAAGDEVLLDDALEHALVAPAVPRALGVNHGDRPALADAEAIRLRARYAAALREAELLEAALEVLPRREAPLLVAALGLALVAAEQHVPLRLREAQRFGDAALPLEVGRDRQGGGVGH